jgi:malonyl-CoA decarboxylase
VAQRSGARRTWLEQVGLVAERGRHILRLRGADRRERNAASLSERLLAQRGEASGLALASDLVSAVRDMDQRGTVEFLEMLAARYSPDPLLVEPAIERWRASRDPHALALLGEVLEPPRQELFRRLNTVPGGTAAIVRLRGRLLDLLPRRPHLRPVDADMRHLLASWFNRGFLRLEEISWRTPAAILERLILYEAVHAIRGWDDLRRRLAADRRCFAFFHPALPDEPLIFVEVALTRGLADAIGPLIDRSRDVADPATADTAVFYSINNTQDGLRGISFGNFLLKQVVSELSAELPRLQTFATLSPLPGFAEALARDEPEGFTEPRLRSLIGAGGEDLGRLAGLDDPVDALRRLLAKPGPYPPPVRRFLGRLALAYLMRIRRGSRVGDPVAHFHLSNGARLESVNVDADLSPGGRQSHGVMVNYVYDPNRLELNHEQYVETGQLAMSRGLTAEAKRVEAAWSSPEHSR